MHEGDWLRGVAGTHNTEKGRNFSVLKSMKPLTAKLKMFRGNCSQTLHFYRGQFETPCLQYFPHNIKGEGMMVTAKLQKYNKKVYFNPLSYKETDFELLGFQIREFECRPWVHLYWKKHLFGLKSRIVNL